MIEMAFIKLKRGLSVTKKIAWCGTLPRIGQSDTLAKPC